MMITPHHITAALGARHARLVLAGLCAIGLLAATPIALAAPPAPTLKSLVSQSKKAMRKGDWAQARTLARQAAKLPDGEMVAEELLETIRQEKSALEWLNKASAHEAAGRLEAAWLAASDGLAQGRTAAWKELRKVERRVKRVLAKTQITLGYRLIGDKKYRQAEAAFAKALQYDPQSKRARAGLVKAGKAGR